MRWLNVSIRVVRDNWSILVILQNRTVRSIRIGGVASLWMFGDFARSIVLPWTSDIIIIFASPVDPLKLVDKVEQASLAWITVEIDIWVAWYIIWIAINFDIILPGTLGSLYLIRPDHTLDHRCNIRHELPLLRLSQFGHLLIIPQFNIMLIHTTLTALNKLQFLQPKRIDLVDDARPLLYTGLYLMPARQSYLSVVKTTASIYLH